METLLAAAFAALFLGGWILEIRIHNKTVEWYRNELKSERNRGWEEGRCYEVKRQQEQHPRKCGQFTERKQ